jgi:hypothetical protein
MTMMSDVLTILMPAAGAIGAVGYLVGTAHADRRRTRPVPAIWPGPIEPPAELPEPAPFRRVPSRWPTNRGLRQGTSLAALDRLHDPLA